ncbi:ankyrin [Lojkania enalia]|uniref:Ankyrin n=1 Tax=Lojkania enalia TaxID=147567 RepID=A0A9P4TPW3_9PLEO|nr:ankyrin [Didymosphaeria enalia]
MQLTDLPLEILHEILHYAIIARGLKRGARLRLVCKLFAIEVFQTEPANGRPMLLLVKQIAQQLAEENPAKTVEEQTVESVIGLLSAGICRHRCKRQTSLLPVLSYEWDSEDEDEFNEEGFMRHHLFHAAAYVNGKATVELLKPFGLNGSTCDIFGTFEAIAAFEGNIDVLEAARTCPSTSALNSACKSGSFHTFKFLYDWYEKCRGWDFDGPIWNTENVESVLNWWLKTPSLEIFDFVMKIRRTTEKWCAPLRQDVLGSLLWTCSENGWTQTVERILDLGADVNGSPGQTRPIIKACERGHLHTVQLFLNRDASTKGAIATAAYYGHTQIINVLLEHGAETIGAIAKGAAGGYMDIVQLLVEYGADVNKDYPIVFAVGLEHTKMFRYLVEHGAVLSDKARHACIEQSRSQGLESMMELLKNHGVDAYDLHLEQVNKSLQKVAI